MTIDANGDFKLEGVSLRSLPKVSLHDHLDGAVRIETVVELAEAAGIELPGSGVDGLADWYGERTDSGSPLTSNALAFSECMSWTAFW